MTYLWEKPTWPSFSWTHSSFLNALIQARHEQGRVLALGQSFVHSFEVSDQRKEIFADWFVPGLTKERLIGWHASLYPTGFAGIKKIRIGEFRSKDFSRSSLPYKNLEEELGKYLHWWNEPPVELDPFLRSATAFLWFMFLSPFEEGNFILATALAEKTLVEHENLKFRTYDLSLQLDENKERIIEHIESAASGSSDITAWIVEFLQMTSLAIESAIGLAEHQNRAESFWKQMASFDLNQRQKKILSLMFEQDLKMTNRLYVDICKTSRESAKRDLAELLKLKLVDLGKGKGRSVQYSLYLIKA
jgi:Fic family protein